MIAIAVEVLTCRQSESTAGSRQCRARAHRHHWGHGTGAHCSQDFLQRSQLHNCFLIVSYHFSLSLSLYLICSYLIFTGSAVSTIHWGPQKIGSVFAAEPLVHLVDTNYPWQFLLLCSWPLSCWLFLDEASSAFLEASSVNQKGLLQCYFIQTSCSLAFLPTECAKESSAQVYIANTL